MFADCPAEPLTTSGTERCHSGRHAAPVSVPTGFYCVPHKDRKRVLLAVLSFVRALGFPLLLPPPPFHFPTPLSNVKLVCVQLLYRPTSLPMPNWCVCLVVVPSLSPFSKCQTGVYPVVGTTTGYQQPDTHQSSLLSQCQTGCVSSCCTVPLSFLPVSNWCVSSCTVPLSLLPMSGWRVSSCTVLPSLPMSNRCVSSRCTVPLSLLPMSNWCVSSCCTVQLISQCQTGVSSFCTVKLLSQCHTGECPVAVPYSLPSQCQTGVCLVVVPSLSPFSQCQTGVCLVVVPSSLLPNARLVCV